MKIKTTTTVISSLVLLASMPLFAQEMEKAPASAYLGSAVRGGEIESVPTKQVFYGDLHLHTGLSLDAVSSDVHTSPEDAYRYARGMSVRYMGKDAKRNAPLDFLAVTDHAEYLGVIGESMKPDGKFADTQWPRLAKEAEGTTNYFNNFLPSFLGEGPAIEEFVTNELVATYWQQVIDAAEKNYVPGEFTSIVGFEWSAYNERGTMHRVVLLEGPDYPSRPFSSLISTNPEDLWDYADTAEAMGMNMLLIPHNSNVSRGKTFNFENFSGSRITRGFAERRREREPLVEIAQAKGISETRPEFSPDDEFAGFEIVNGRSADDPVRSGYVRTGMMNGLTIANEVGVNPYEFGFVGATDVHSGLSGTEEDNFPGGFGISDDLSDPEDILYGANPLIGWPKSAVNAGALTGVWAEENTRESIFAALERREVFATSGNRIRVRLFAGPGFSANLFDANNWEKTAYEQGVPMGGDLESMTEGQQLQFVVHASRDPQGGNLDRIQIVKLWFENGEAHEKIFNVVWSGDRQVDANGKLPTLPDTVDARSASFDESQGTPQLKGIWQDPEFNPALPAIYYARVLAVKTPRWTTYLAAGSNLDVPDSVPTGINERAWTSPVFYSPED